jgi:hypothetical protein
MSANEIKLDEVDSMLYQIAEIWVQAFRDEELSWIDTKSIRSSKVGTKAFASHS